jgi:acyl-CoA hydrolase
MGSTRYTHATRLRTALRDSELLCVSQGAAYPCCSLSAMSALGLLADMRLLVGQIPDDAFLPPNIPVKTFFPSGPLGTSAALAAAKAGYWRASLYQVANSIETKRIEADVAIIKVTAARDGYRSVAFHADYAIPLFETSRKVVLEECSHAPWLGPHIPTNASHIVDLLVGDEQRPRIRTGDDQLGSSLRDIGRKVALTLPNSAIVQLGMGKWTRAVAAEIGNRGIARFHTGFVDRWLIDFLDALADDEGVDITTSALADDDIVAQHAQRLYECDQLRLQAATTTHHPGTLAALRSFVAINSAWEIDLLGRANCEYVVRGEEVVRRGIAGLWDFASAAAAQGDGLSIIALPARSKDRSRIVPQIESTHVSLPSNLVDIVVTEYGLADLRGLSVDERIGAVASVAAPADRSRLIRAAARLGMNEAAVQATSDAGPFGEEV